MLDIFILLFLILIIIFIILLTCNKILNMNKLNNYNTSCYWRRWGCCKDNITPKLDIFGSNCRGF